ncbi:MAG: glycosyltransferase family 4 protein [Chloroflexi bacterium]|nr:glycosyltransferase family 4 protein [Chloroflexota bacterium]MBP7043327.1 glycosyltransferase family 4 protein [Chloroflexota bacterium]
MRIAYFSPLPPARSGIADYSRDLLPYLAREMDLTLYAAEPEQVDAALRQQFDVRPLAAYPQERWQSDLPLYQMGNSAHHADHYAMMQRYPGVVVLHDYFLHHFIAHTTAGQGRYDGYTREMGYAHGSAGTALAWAIRAGQAQHPLASLPLNQRILDLNLGVMVHSRTAAEWVREVVGNGRLIQTIHQPITPMPGQSRRAELGWPAEAVIFACAGEVTLPKQVDRALRAFSRLRQEGLPVYFLIIGGESPEVGLDGQIADLGIGGSVWRTGFVPDLAAFNDWLHTADVVINLRAPTLGETSAAALRAMAAARPLLVYDHGWYGELPETAVTRLPPLDDDALLAAMRHLAQSAAARQSMGQAALGYITGQCQPEQVAGAYHAFLRDLLRALPF